MQFVVRSLALLSLLGWPVSSEDCFAGREAERNCTDPVTKHKKYEGCQCGHKQSHMGCDDHPFMLCSLDIQGVDVKMLVPDAHYPGCFFEFDHRIFSATKLLPPWGRQTHPPFSLWAAKKGSVVVEIGSHYGLFSLLTALAFPDVKVIAIEPNFWLADLLRENARNNGISKDRFTVLEAPITGDGRKVDFLQHIFWHQYSNIYRKPFGPIDDVHDFGPENHEYTYQSMTITQALAAAGAEAKDVSYINIGCEGCEQEIMQEVADWDIPFWMQCHSSAEPSKYAEREWMPLNWMTHLTEKDASKCLELQALGEARLLERAAAAGYPAEKALLSIQLLAEGNYSLAVDMFTNSGDTQTKYPQQGPAAMQYNIITEALRSVTAFFAASALADGQGVKRDMRAAMELFEGVATSPERLHGLEADMDVLNEALPMLKDAQSGAMYRLAQLLSEGGNHEESDKWYAKAAGLGHALARAHIIPAADGRLVGTNGRVAGHPVRQLMTMARLEALGVPHNLHETMLGNAASGAFDKCIRQDQEESVPRWEDVFEGKGSKYEAMGAYRFRSWFHSAMGCWLKQG